MGQTIQIATFNVNSLKARLSHVLEWLRKTKPDIVLFQETKTIDAQFPALEIEDLGYNLAVHGQKTYNGVAIASKFPLDDITRGLAGEPEDEQARYIEAVASINGQAIRVASVYVPNGQAVDSEKFAYKLRFYDRLRAHWIKQLRHYEIAVLAGDFNCAPAPIDVYDANALDGTVCFHPLEREKLRALCFEGLTDAFRTLHPDKSQFSWWDYRNGGYERGHGLRIDHILCSALACDTLTQCIIDETPRNSEKPSDHAPVIASFTL